MTDEVSKSISISFEIDELHFFKETGPMLNCTLEQWQQATRVVITSQLGYALKSLRQYSAAMRTFADTLSIPQDYSDCQILLDLLYLLPGTSPSKEELIRALDAVTADDSYTLIRRRTLANYRSYFKFDHYVWLFWKNATPEEKILYFPVYLWWKLTAVLPLRPTECVLTPRNCLSKDNGKYYLTVRRTKRKGTQQETRYSIEQDYEKEKYQITDVLGDQIAWYIENTRDTYISDIDVLFCKHSQFQTLNLSSQNDSHYTYANLRQCLGHFNERVLCEKYGLEIVGDVSSLEEQEIQKIQLGDTRHIAMVSLALSGGSPTICRELAGHESIEISAHYFSHVKSFLDALSYTGFQAEIDPPMTTRQFSCDRSFPVLNGYCQSANVKQGDFSPCGKAVSANGTIGDCTVCMHYLTRTSTSHLFTEQAERNLEQACQLLKYSLDQLHKGMGNEDTLLAVLDQLKTRSLSYLHASAVSRKIIEERL